MGDGLRGITTKDDLRRLLTGGVRLQIARAIPLFNWNASDRRRAEKILLENVDFPQTFVRAWALDSLATFSITRKNLRPTVARYLEEFEYSPSKALQARARKIRERLGK